MRLPRTRRGKTPLDVTITNQPAGPRVRITFGDDGSGKKNSDLDVFETQALITYLEFHLAKIRGEISE